MAPHLRSHPRRALARATLAAAVLLASSTAHAAVTLPSIFSDGVVLQQREGSGSRALVYGRAAPGETVAVTLAMDGQPPQRYAATAAAAGDAEPGAWIVTLNPNDAAGNGTLTVAGSEDGYNATTVVEGVTFGDVYLCSGEAMCARVWVGWAGRAGGAVAVWGGGRRGERGESGARAARVRWWQAHIGPLPPRPAPCRPKQHGL